MIPFESQKETEQETLGKGSSLLRIGLICIAPYPNSSMPVA